MSEIKVQPKIQTRMGNLHQITTNEALGSIYFQLLFIGTQGLGPVSYGVVYLKTGRKSTFISENPVTHTPCEFRVSQFSQALFKYLR